MSLKEERLPYSLEAHLFTRVRLAVPPASAFYEYLLYAEGRPKLPVAPVSSELMPLISGKREKCWQYMIMD